MAIARSDHLAPNVFGATAAEEAGEAPRKLSRDSDEKVGMRVDIAALNCRDPEETPMFGKPVPLCVEQTAVDGAIQFTKMCSDQRRGDAARRSDAARWRRDSGPLSAGYRRHRLLGRKGGIVGQRDEVGEAERGDPVGEVRAGRGRRVEAHAPRYLRAPNRCARGWPTSRTR